MRAVRYMGGAVTPWALARQSMYWTFLALDCERVDQRAQQIADKIAEQRSKGGEDDEDDATE